MARKKTTPKKTKQVLPDGVSCQVRICVDPKTGMAVVKKSGKCPPGWVEQVKSAITDRGIGFEHSEWDK